MNLPTVSIIIPTPNSARTLTSCLDSILIQDYPRGRLEIIIAGGGSTDGTPEIINCYPIVGGLSDGANLSRGGSVIWRTIP